MGMGDGRKSTSYRDLVAWQKAIILIDEVHALTDSWPGHETFGLRSQIRRAAVSVAANIAEGPGRNGRNEFHHHLGIVFGSLCEVETMLIVGLHQNDHKEERQSDALAISREVGRLIIGLRRSLRAYEPAQ